MTQTLLSSTFIATPTTHALLCKLLGEYKIQADVRPTLAAMKELLGEPEYRNFEADLAKLMQNGRTAVGAVKEMITRSIERRMKPPVQQEVRVSNRHRFD